jgi:hypothetical protein
MTLPSLFAERRRKISLDLGDPSIPAPGHNPTCAPAPRRPARAANCLRKKIFLPRLRLNFAVA